MTTSAEEPRDAVLAAYDRQVDGLFTYCLSVLCEHDAAADALREVRELALRHGARLAEPGLLRAWLYSLARYCCLRRLQNGPGTWSGAGHGAGAAHGPRPGLPAVEAARRRRELASLAWPAAAGTDPEQREALELSVRHRLSPIEVAAVLGVPFDTARTLLASAQAEVDRTGAALLVPGVRGCPGLDRLGGAGAESRRNRVLGPAPRRELVRHVMDCPTCRGTAERVAGGAAESAAGLSGLPVLSAPAARPGRSGGVVFLPQAARTVGRAGSAGRVAVVEPGLRFDQSGFPRHRAPDAGRGSAVRRRVVTTGVLAAVLFAPVAALWAGHRSGGTARVAASVSSVRVDAHGRPAGYRPEGPGSAVDRPDPVGRMGQDGAAPATAGLELAGTGVVSAETLPPGAPGPAIAVPSRGATPLGNPLPVTASAPGGGLPAGPTAAGQPAPPAPAGQLTVEAGEYGNRTVLTLTNSGSTEIRWHAAVDAAWLRLGRDAGTLAPGQRITVIVTVDEELAPAVHWSARIALPPSQAVVTLEGGPHNRGGGTSASTDPTTSPADPDRPSQGGTPGGTPSATPTGPGPTAVPSSPAPTASPTAAPSTSSPSPSPPAPTVTASTPAPVSPSSR
ncbi:sigma-70 family RNA polymerase sigma factor [Kitasatospora sp. NPDC088548]|uniref:BACON domain-containing protein n=1 Tax=Kitasatospora sp. NPDC088548 TaxID=3364075 RepID=UPI00380A636D